MSDYDDLETMNRCLDSMYWRQHKISGELRIRVKELEDALHEILDQATNHPDPVGMIREIAKQALGEETDVD